MADNSSRRFKFISPGVFVNEIDNSQFPQLPGEVGPLLIGRSRKGPANKPVKMTSFSDFVETFGYPVPGNKAGDVWREGNLTAPTYAAFAAQAWLRNGSPITFLRVLGDESTNATASGKAGWKVPQFVSTGGNVPATNDAGGVYALCVWPSSSAGAVLDGAVAAQFYMESGRVLLSGNLAGNVRDGAGLPIASCSGSSIIEVSSVDDFVLLFSGSTAAVDQKVTVSLNPDSENFIRKALNTNPTITNAAITDASTRSFYQNGMTWLGESFERSIVASGANSIGLLSSDTSKYFAAMLPMAQDLNLGTVNAVQQNDFEGAATKATTGWFIAQDLTNDITDWKARNMQKLFRFEALTAGESVQREVKVSISNIKAPEGDYQDFGTFSVLVRSLSDTDSRPEILERYDELTLNPASPNYIAARIGDKYEVYSQTDLRMQEYGEFDNNSNFIRVVMNEDVAAGAGETRWLPFGCFGPLKYRDVGYASGSAGWASSTTAPAVTDRNLVNTMLTGGPLTTYGNIGHFTAIETDELEVPVFPASTTLTVDAATITKAGVNLDTFTLTDAGGTPQLFTFNSGDDVIAGGAIGVLSATDGDAAFFASQIAASIEAALDITAIVTTTGGVGVDAVITLIQDAGGVAGNTTADMTSVDGVSGTDFTGGGIFQASLAFPSVPLRKSSTWGTPRSLKNTFWGAWSGRTGADTFFSPQLADCLRPRSFDLSAYNADPASTSHDVQGEIAYVATDPTTIAWCFSLDDLSGSAGDGYTYAAGQRAAGTSLSAPLAASYKTVLNAGADRFTAMLFGGSDGYDITEREPFRNSKMTATDENDSYELFSLRKAINIASDPDYVQMNAVSIPGIWRPAVTNFLLDTVEERADALAIIDIQYGYVPSAEDTGSAETRNASSTATQAAATLADRSINNSYGATYYPWVRILDTNTNQNLWVPPSVAAMGVLSSTDRLNAPWFAPAGFTRGGLSEGAAGVPVLDVSRRLTSDERDTLYVNNINPIAKFPAEGIVVFGQKTLQQTSSALDRVNVRRLMIYLKREISFIASRLLFGPNTQDTWDRFLGQANPLLESVRAESGIEDFRLVLDETTTTPDLIDRNIMYAKLLVKPTRAVEYFAIDFVVTNSGASFED
tara:strand:+ start:4458 stop:7847 length:3390 start_codon:yes stop_codon:yes gene_type:complete